ncbi:Octopamine receptor beta-2R [Dissostichus eleginoides]|uniref:Octopamine receptor beta-2R n=1 Tax=Dissostichus eleginoides TaxID=100907 RepID=A0AAD9EVH3_DISEL|nr:Octopamine receptor beta-2R [Dissostichus eleginoides]
MPLCRSASPDCGAGTRKPTGTETTHPHTLGHISEPTGGRLLYRSHGNCPRKAGGERRRKKHNNLHLPLEGGSSSDERGQFKYVLGSHRPLTRNRKRTLAPRVKPRPLCSGSPVSPPQMDSLQKGVSHAWAAAQ